MAVNDKTKIIKICHRYLEMKFQKMQKNSHMNLKIEFN